MTMTRAGSLLVIVTAASCGQGPTPAAPATPAGLACTSNDAVKAEATQLAVRNQAAFTRALAEQGLREPSFAADYFEDRDDGSHEWQVVDAAAGRTLLAPLSYLSCGVSNPWRLAQDGSGGVFALLPSERETAHHTRAICGCEADIPVTCGGAAAQPVRWRWALPTATDFKGPLSVVIDHETLTTTFAGRGDGEPCPPPTAPP